jgi:titin
MSNDSWRQLLSRRVSSASRGRGERRDGRKRFRPKLETLEDRTLPTVYLVTSTADHGTGTLHQAILNANTDSGPDIIRFHIGAGGKQTINLTSPLPTVANTLVIDGTSQPGWTKNPLIVLDGHLITGPGVNGLTLTADHCVVKGLVIQKFSNDGIDVDSSSNLIRDDSVQNNAAYGVALIDAGSNNTVGGTTGVARNLISGNGAGGVLIFDNGTSGNLVEGNYIGTDAAGTTALGNGALGDGVDIGGGASNNTVGGIAPGARNLISGNKQSGVLIAGDGTDGNVVAGNYIGVDVTGLKALGSATGVLLSNGASGNTVGGTAAHARNVISGNDVGVEMVSALTDATFTSGNVVAGNYIGTTATGTSALGDKVAGVQIEGTANSNTVGGTGLGARNVISGNGEGVVMSASQNLVSGNFIGLDKAGTTKLGNSSDGIHIENGAASNTIGGTQPGAANVISGNLLEGVLITDAGSSGNVVAGNLIGTDTTGTKALGNDSGVEIRLGAANNTLGGTDPGAGNVISGNQSGVIIGDNSGGANDNVLLGNRIGTDVTGTVPLGNTGFGILIQNGSTSNTIGGTAQGTANVISGNSNGVRLDASANVVLGNLIGTDKNGTVQLGNKSFGIVVGNGASNTIGGTVQGAANVISGNFIGVRLEGTSNVVLGNLIGTDKSGTKALGTGDGMEILGGNNTIGGTAPGAGNVISGNYNGVVIGIEPASSTQNVVLGNRIGTDVTGTVPLGNINDGILIQSGSSSNTIGGTAQGAGNVVSGNGNGVVIGYPVPGDQNVVLGNLIGTDVTGTVPLGNTKDGIRIEGQGTSNTIGGTVAGAGNTIAFNHGFGVLVGSSTGTDIRQNSIFANTSGGIGIGGEPGPVLGTPIHIVGNNPGDQQSGTLDAAKSTTYILEFFTNAVCDPSGFGQGQTFVTSITVTTDANGHAGFTAFIPQSFLVGEPFITATATDPNGTTSGFSNCTGGNN